MSDTISKSRGGRGGVISRLASSIFGPGMLVLALLVAAMTLPMLEEADAPGPRAEVLLDGIVSQVLFAPDGRGIIVDQGRSGPVRMDVVGGGLRRGMAGGGLPCVRMAIDPQGFGLVLALNDNSLRVVDPITLEVLGEMAGHDDRVQVLTVSDNGEILVSADYGGVVKVWEMATGALLRRFSTDLKLTAGAMSPDGSRIAMGDSDGRIAVFDTVSGVERARWSAQRDGNSRGTLDIDFAPSGDEVASVGMDGRVRFWDGAAGWALRGEIALPSGISRCVVYSLDGRQVATGHWDGRVRFWDVGTGVLLAAEPMSTLPITAIAFEPGGDRLAASSGAGVAIHDIPAVSGAV